MSAEQEKDQQPIESQKIEQNQLKIESAQHLHASLKLENLSKQYLQRNIFNNLNFTINGNGIYRLIGENGTGKSTLLTMVAGMTTVDSGKIWIHGQQCTAHNVDYQKMVAYVPDQSPIYDFMQGQEFLDLICSIRKLKVESYRGLAEQFNLQQFLKITFAEMSLGTAKKFLLVSALMSEVKVLLLDEPNNGLDQVSLNVLKNKLQELSSKCLILVTCHEDNFLVDLAVTPIRLSELTSSKNG